MSTNLNNETPPPLPPTEPPVISDPVVEEVCQILKNDLPLGKGEISDFQSPY